MNNDMYNNMNSNGINNQQPGYPQQPVQNPQYMYNQNPVQYPNSIQNPYQNPVQYQVNNQPVQQPGYPQQPVNPYPQAPNVAQQQSEIASVPSSFSPLKMYGEDLTQKHYITNPAIARNDEIRKLMVVLLTPDKSGLLIGKAGIGKTAIVEGLAFLIERNAVPDALKGYRVIKINSTSLLGKIEINGREEMIVSLLVDELKRSTKTILFIDEIHTLIGGSNDGPMDLANILKPALDRGDIKVIGATTTEEYQAYVIKDRAFLRRFDRIDVLEPDEPTTVEILYQSLPRIEQKTGIRVKYNGYVTKLLIESVVSATSQYKRVFGLSAMYPDVAFSVLNQAFSNALFANKKEVDITDFYMAIKNSKRIFPDSIYKELIIFKQKFKDICNEEGIVLPDVARNEIEEYRDEY